MKRLPVLIGIVLLSQCSAYAVMTAEDALTRMEAAKQAIDSLECKLTVTRQSCGRYFINENGVKDYELTPDSKQWIPPAIYTFHEICSGNRFNRTEHSLDDSGNPAVYHDVWGEQQYVEYREGSGWALIFNKPTDTGGAFVQDPRCLAYRRSPVRSIIDALRVGQANGILKVSDDVLKSIPVVYVECIYPKGKINDIGYMLWIDPARGFMPIQIQVNAGPFLCDQFMDIELHEVEPGVWLPIRATIYNHQIYNEADRTIVNVIQKIEVDVDSIKLNPAVSDRTFGISLPPGTEVHDRRTKPEVIYQASRAPDVESDIFMEADVAKAEMVNASVAAMTNPSDTARHFMFGRKALAVYGSLMLFGFVMSWLLTRSRRA